MLLLSLFELHIQQQAQKLMKSNQNRTGTGNFMKPRLYTRGSLHENAKSFSQGSPKASGASHIFPGYATSDSESKTSFLGWRKPRCVQAHSHTLSRRVKTVQRYFVSTLLTESHKLGSSSPISCLGLQLFWELVLQITPRSDLEQDQDEVWRSQTSTWSYFVNVGGCRGDCGPHVVGRPLHTLRTAEVGPAL